MEVVTETQRFSDSTTERKSDFIKVRAGEGWGVAVIS